MDVPFFQVDAFTDRPFAGNPAAICLLEDWLPEDQMQRIAEENAVSETAFVVPKPDGGKARGEYGIRWFTPKVEVDLCGHATLGSGHVLFQEIGLDVAQVTFDSKSGPLVVSRADGRLTLDFPSRRPAPATAPALLAEALGALPSSVLKGRDYLAVFDTAEQIRNLAPDFDKLAAIPDTFAVGVTAPGTGGDGDVDFVSRFFAPAKGVPEDPVTGSLHCALTPYWAGRLGKQSLRARQVSARGGELWCRLADDRVMISGTAVTVIRGSFQIISSLK